jgi:hypothetical protein
MPKARKSFRRFGKCWIEDCPVMVKQLDNTYPSFSAFRATCWRKLRTINVIECFCGGSAANPAQALLS